MHNKLLKKRQKTLLSRLMRLFAQNKFKTILGEGEALAPPFLVCSAPPPPRLNFMHRTIGMRAICVCRHKDSNLPCNVYAHGAQPKQRYGRRAYQRESLLQRAMQISPDNTSARWQDGSIASSA